MVRLPNGELRFTDPQGQDIEPAPRPPATQEMGLLSLERLNTQAGLQIDAETGLTRWDGDTIDYEAAIDVLVRGGFAPLDSSGFPCLRAVGSPEVPPAITSRPA